jgi:two-component system chemotaxis sensor kinase CheA
MSSLDQLKNTFFDECSEALQNIEAGLTDIRQGHGDDDTINAVFRSVHSVKGGAGIFGFDSLVGFAHVFETVLDAMRAGTLTASPEIVDVLLPANDVLTDLISMSRAAEAIPPDFGRESRAALESLLGKTEGDREMEGDAAPADFEGLDFMPVMVDQMDDAPGAAAADNLQTYRLVFRPQPEMLRRANEPLYIIRELQKLGELDLTAEVDRLPHLNELEYDRPYIGWTGTLRTEAARAQIEEVFEFVTGDCQIDITLEEAPVPMPAVAEAVAIDCPARRWPRR